MFKKKKDICKDNIDYNCMNSCKKGCDIKFYYCKHCGKIISIINNPGTPTICCGEPMEELIAGMEDASLEKHVPVIKKFKCCAIVTVGSSFHPMTADHHIEWIMLHTNMGIQKKCLDPEGKPQVMFPLLPDEKIEGVYAYCNIHRLWKN